MTFFLSASVFCVRFWKIFFVKRQRCFVDLVLGLREVGLGALHDFFHRQIGREREAQFLAELVRADPEITVGALEQVLLQPLLVVFQCLRGFFLNRCDVLLQLRRLVQERIKSIAHEIDCALRLFDCRFRMNASADAAGSLPPA